MKAVRHLAYEIEYKRRDFQVGEEIVEGKHLLGVYEECSVHVAKIIIKKRRLPLFYYYDAVIRNRSSSLKEARCFTHTKSKCIASANRVPYSLSAK